MSTQFMDALNVKLALDTFIQLTRTASTLKNRLFISENLGCLTASQFGVMEILYHQEPLYQGEISSLICLSSSNITFVLDNLEKAGYVKRVRDESDRRMVKLYLTPEGSDEIARIDPLMVQKITAEMAVLTDTEQKTLGRLCNKVGLWKI
jgi:MarR family 2-MHQ and catechol resistance regulon transcriptional repressor